jgi:hypothetical protein
MVVQQGWPGCPQASHWETPPIATQVLPALHDVPLHGRPVAPVPPDEPPPLLPEAEPPLLLLPEPDPLLLLPEPDPPLLAPSEPASGVAAEMIPPPHPASATARNSPQASRPRLRDILRP